MQDLTPRQVQRLFIRSNSALTRRWRPIPIRTNRAYGGAMTSVRLDILDTEFFTCLFN